MGLLIYLSGEKITHTMNNTNKKRAEEIAKIRNNVAYFDNMDFLEYPSDGKNYEAYYRDGEIVYIEIAETNQKYSADEILNVLLGVE